MNELPQGRGMDVRALLDAFRASPDVLVVLSRDGTIVSASRALGGIEADALPGLRLSDLASGTSAQGITAALCSLDRSGSVVVDAAFPADGTLVWYQLSLAPFAGAPDRILMIASDITDRRAREDRLQRAEELMNDAQGAAHLGTWEWDPTQPHAIWSAELYRIYGLTPESYTPSYEAYLAKVHPDDRAHVMAATNQVFTKHEPYSHDERILRPDGTIRYLHTWAHAIVDASGKVERLIGVCQDVTDRKLVEIELAARNVALVREADERERVETLLRRGQKLEAIGRLTGGIAHDFNNVLGVVMGYASVLHGHMPHGSKDREYVAEIMSAVERAGRMTSQLLSFSSDHAIKRGPLELDRVVRELAQLMRRLIGEEIELEVDLDEDRRGPEERAIVVDASGSQIEQVLMNLAVNARDAMADGGTLTITTARTSVGAGTHVPPGPYALVSISDTGTGMSGDVQSQAFDPFFTTKEHGKGTGLGLSTVYGIVKQSGGSITVASEPGKGTRFEILLPIVAVGARAAAREASPLGTPRGTETILLVEDENALRTVLRGALEGYGYRVLEAEDGEAALAAASDQAATIDLVLTDVVMPRLSGRELVERLTADRPKLRVLYMSGYTNDVVLRRGVIEGSVALIRKPFTAEQLGKQLRELLDEAREQPTV